MCDKAAGNQKINKHEQQGAAENPTMRRRSEGGVQGDLAWLPNLLTTHHLNNLDVISANYCGAQQTICGVTARS